MRGWQVKLCDPLKMRAMRERFCGEVSRRRDAISSVLYLYLYLFSVSWLKEEVRKVRSLRNLVAHWTTKGWRGWVDPGGRLHTYRMSQKSSPPMTSAIIDLTSSKLNRFFQKKFQHWKKHKMYKKTYQYYIFHIDLSMLHMSLSKFSVAK